MREVPLPDPQSGEVLIKVQAAGVNPADEKVRMGANPWQMPYRFLLTLGFDLTGTVERLGAGSSRFVGRHHRTVSSISMAEAVRAGVLARRRRR